MANEYHRLSTGAFTQNWTNTGLITADDNWSGVPSIIGYRGDDLTATTGVDPQTITADGTTTPVDVIANQNTPDTLNTGGVAEFELTNSVVALNGSGTADAPFLLVHLDTLGVTNINVSYTLRDIDGSVDNSIQPVALQYRVGTSGNFVNIPAAFVTDASSGPSLATQTTTVNATLPAAAENQSQVQLRIITANASGNDEWIGIDDINISAVPAKPNIQITEYMYSGTNGEFVEFTNLGSTPVDMTGWSFNDSARTPGAFSLSGFGTVQPNESVILTETAEVGFRTAWNLPSSVKVIGGLTPNLGRGDEINLYDNNNQLIDRLTYNDQTFTGTIRTQNTSGWTRAENLNSEVINTDWVLSTVGDAQNSYSSVGLDIGNPGVYVTSSTPTAGVTVTQTDGTTRVTEGGTTDTYTLVLNKQPTADVTITVNPDTQITTTPSTLTFTPANWNIAQTVTVGAVDDSAVENVHSGIISHTITTTDTSYSTVTIGNITASITDNDVVTTPGTLAPGDVIFNEYVADNNADDNDFFELLVLKDNADLRGLRVSDNELAGGTLNNGESVFVFGNDTFLNNVPKGTTIGVWTAETNITPDTSVNPAGNDWKMILAPGTGVTNVADGLGGTTNPGLAAGGDALYLYLPGADGTSAGTDNIYLDYISYENDNADAPTGLADINLPSLADNAYYTGNTAAGNDVVTNWVTYDLPAIPNNPTPGDANPGQDLSALRSGATATRGVTIAQTEGNTKVTEGGATDTYTVVLNTQPTADVTIAINSGTQTTTAPNSLTFTNANWNVAQTVAVTAVDDTAIEGDHSSTITHTATSTDTNYNGISVPSVTAAITDNDFGILKKIGSYAGGTFGAEITSYDPVSKRLFVIDGSATAQVLNFSDPTNPTLISTINLSTYGAAATSVAVKNGLVAFSVAANVETDPGKVVFYNTTGDFIKDVTVGALPDMITFSHDGTKVLTANEGQPGSTIDPVGSVSIINVANGAANATVATASFTSFDGQEATLRSQGVRIFPNKKLSEDVEPEYITFSKDGAKAWVTLQENNAVAIVDVASATVNSIVPLGLVDYSQPGNGLDASDRDGANGTGSINIKNYPVFGMYMPDAIASFEANGRTYYITANEGDTRNENARVSTLNLDATKFPDAATLKLEANLGRLDVSTIDGDTDGDGDYDRLLAYGARSFTIWDDQGKLVYNSGDQFERITASQTPTIFNSEGITTNFDSRSDNKGPEPEGVTVGVIDGRTYAFVGLERTGGVMVYEVTNPQKPQFVQYLPNQTGDLSPEGVSFIPATESPNNKNLLVLAHEISNTVAVFEVNPQIRISNIQGAAHTSPLNGQAVKNVPGIVTALRSNGFYLQDPNPDSNDATSEGIFVFTSSAPTVAVGDSIQVSGTVSEFRPGGTGGTNNLTTTQISSPTIVKLSSGNALPTATVIGNGGRAIPNQVISNDAVGGTVENPGTVFDPTQDGIDFYESMEGMLVQVNNPVAVGPTNNFGEIPVVADNGANAGTRTARGGIVIQPTDFNPERIFIDDALIANPPKVNVGDKFNGSVVGVMDYSFSNFKLFNTQALPTVTSGGLEKEVTGLTPNPNQLTVGTFNVENLDPNDGDTKFNNLANRIVNNLKAPDILTIEEIQDNNGATNDTVVDASQTYNKLISAIAAAGGPTYQFRQINPVDDQDGGEPGGNIRVGFLFNPNRVLFVERPGGTSTANTTVNNVGGVPQLSASPGRLDPTNTAFNASRKPLVGEFVFQGQTIFVVGNHFNSKGGDQPLFGRFQPPTLTSETQRNQQATIVKDFVQSILAINPNANVVVMGDLNDFEFSNPINTLESAGLKTLIESLPENERYTYNFEGNAQSLDHIMVSNNLFNNLDGFDVVHINSEFADQDSDHDPSVARFNIKTPANQPKITNYDFTNLPKLGTTSKGQDIFLGGFSGLYFQGLAPNGNLKFVTHTDRGPNGEPTGQNRPFLLPNFQPEIINFELKRSTGEITITKRTGLFRQDGTTKLTGLPNLQAAAGGLAYTDEVGVDLDNKVLPNDPLGADLEGIVVAENGDYWMVDEYRPAIYHFDINGKLLERFIPKGTATAPEPDQAAGTYGTEVLPEVYAQRRNNRGFEAVALEGNKLYAFIQSAIDNPDSTGDTTSRNSRNLRILEFDIVSKAVTGEYLYLLDDITASGLARTDKIGDAVSLGNGKFAVVERDDISTTASNKLIYQIDLAAATNINNPANFSLPTGKSIEQLTVAELATAKISPVSKSLIANAAQLGYTGVEKLEGLALVAPNTLALINDNDFNVTGTTATERLGILELPNNLPVAQPALPNGVASGDTTQNSTVLWTRSNNTGTVTFEYSTKSDFSTIAGTKTANVTSASLPVKVDVTGLTAGTEYFYRVTDATGAKATGKFSTAAASGTQAGLRFGVSGDWRGELSPYPAISNADERNLKFFVKLGDTIYSDYASPALRNPDGSEKAQATTLDDFRVKNSEVYSKRFGQNTWGDLRASTSVFATIDDHEVVNDFQGGEDLAKASAADQALYGATTGFVNDSPLYENGLQAFQEYNPISDKFYGATGDNRTALERQLYRYNTFGSDAATFVLDARSFRDAGLAGVANPTDPVQVGQFLAKSFDPTRTMLGKQQLQDLKNDLLKADKEGITWKFVMLPEPMQNLGVVGASDRYEGYAAERTEILKFVNDNKINNVVFVAADIHGTVVNNLTYQNAPGQAQIATNAFEITTGSVAFDAPFGPTVAELAAAAGLITADQKKAFDSLPIANDADSIVNDKDDFIKNLVNNTIKPLGYDPLGLNDNLAQANGLINANLLQGDYVATNTYGWSEFNIDKDTQKLTVTTYGIDAYTRAELEANPSAITSRQPKIVSQFEVAPTVTPVVSVTATEPEAAETNTKAGKFRITRTGELNQSLIVNYTLAGTATNGADYTNLSGTATIEVGQTFADITVAPIDDSVFETSETVVLNLAKTANYNLGTSASATVNIADNDINPVSGLTQNPNSDLFTLTGGSGKPKLQVSFTGRNSSQVNELGVFVVDDATGKIGNLAPGQPGYTEAALARSKTILSAISNLPSGFTQNGLSSLLEFNDGNQIRFYLVKNSTTDAVRANPALLSNVVFADPNTQRVTANTDGSFSLGFKDGSGADFNNLVVKIQPSSQPLPLETNLQGQNQGEVFDLRSTTGRVKFDFTVNREAAFNNLVGFYKVADENGGIDITGDGIADINPGQTGYAQAAMNARVADINLAVTNQGQATFNDKLLTGGSIYAPFLLTNGRTVDQVLAGQVDQAYFAYLGANSDKVDHVRLLGNNTFGFEDIAGGGDFDYNDIIVKATLTPVV